MKKGFALPLIILLLLSVFILGLVYFFSKTLKNPALMQNVDSQKYDVEEANDNETYFITKLDFNNFQLENIPWGYKINSVWVDGNNVWVGSGGILKFDANTSQLKTFSDSSKFPCSAPTIAVIKRSLFVACWGSPWKEVKNDMNKKGIYEFNLDTMKLKKKVELSKEIQNLEITADGEYVWGATFSGVFRYEPVSGKIKWYTNALKSNIKEVLPKENFNIKKVYVWGKEVWALISSNEGSRGYLTRYNRVNDTWTAYGPETLEPGSETFTVLTDEVVGVEGEGVWANGQKFDFSEQSWKKSHSLPDKNSGKVYEVKAVENINQEELYLKNPATGSFQKLPFFFRSAWKTKNIGEKIYMLTSHSVDVMTREDPYPKVLKKLGFEINEQLEYMNFDLSEDEEFAFAWYASFGMEAFDAVALIPLNETQKAITDFQPKSKDYEISKLQLKKEDDYYYLFSTELNRNVYKIDTSLRKITLIKI